MAQYYTWTALSRFVRLLPRSRLPNRSQYWLNQLSIPAKIEFAPYNQVVQTLVDAHSVFARNKNGLNVVLVRFEDWERSGGNANEWKGRCRELIAALKTAASIGPSPILVCICSGSAERLEQELETELAGMSNIRFLSSKRLRQLYPVTNWHDAGSDQLGHIPYTPEAYAALGTAIARVFHASRRAPYKVIVTDCDNTLWRGICGESGPHGIELDAAGLAVQRFLKLRQQEGMLLCVCSKNAPEDVDQAFDAHPEMPLARSDFAGWRVNCGERHRRFVLGWRAITWTLTALSSTAWRWPPTALRSSTSGESLTGPARSESTLGWRLLALCLS